MPVEYAAPPLRADIAEPDSSRHPMAAKMPKLKINKEWFLWLSGIVELLQKAPTAQGRVLKASEQASISTTPVEIGQVSQGIWRVSTHLRVKTPATVSSSVQVTISWTDGGVAQSESGTLLNGNLTTTREGKTFIIRTDASSPISYAVAYASVGATAMIYTLDVVVEQVGIE